MSSDIWDEYEKIAVAQGLVDTEEREQEDASKMPDRYDSLSNDAIRLLYNVEPESIFKEKDIIETAHPETAIINRTYDAMNSVVENVNQRQDIMAWIALKMPDGHLTQKRYVAAKAELMNSLVRAAFALDNHDETDLMKLADSCAEKLSAEEGPQIKKEALAPIIPIATALLGLVGYFAYGPTTAQSVYTNSQKVLDALNDLSDKPYYNGIYASVANLMRAAADAYEVKNKLSNVKTVEDAVEVAKNPSEAAEVKEVNQKLHEYIQHLLNVKKSIPGWVSAIENVHSTSQQGQSDFMAKLRGIVDVAWNFDHEQLIDALWGKNVPLAGRSGGLNGAIDKELQIMQRAISSAQQEQPKIEQEVQQEQKAPQFIAQQQPAAQMPAPTPAPKPQEPGAGAARKQPDEGLNFTGPTW